MKTYFIKVYDTITRTEKTVQEYAVSQKDAENNLVFRNPNYLIIN